MVRSEAELDELAFELFEQEEVNVCVYYMTLHLLLSPSLYLYLFLPVSLSPCFSFSLFVLLPFSPSYSLSLFLLSLFLLLPLSLSPSPFLSQAMDRHRRTHATIPSMLTDEKERKVQFISTNGLVKDPMAIYRESKAISTWTDEEKRIFKEKYVGILLCSLLCLNLFLVGCCSQVCIFPQKFRKDCYISTK